MSQEEYKARLQRNENMFAEKLNHAIAWARLELNISYYEVLGCLEAIKHNLLEEYSYREEWTEDEPE